MEFKITAFESRLKKEKILAKCIDCHGYPWRLSIFPWGDRIEDKGYVSVYLNCVEEGTRPTAKFCLRAVNPDTKPIHCDFEEIRPCTGYGFSRFMKREKVIDALDSTGAFIVQVDIQVLQSSSQRIWRPKKTLQEDLTGFYRASEHTDVTFSVSESKIQVHSVVIASACPNLLEIVSLAKPEEIVLIDRTDPDIFKTMIDFMYDNRLPKMSLHQKLELISLADRFEYVHLKLWLEADIVESGSIAPKNAATVLLFAAVPC